MTEDTPLDDAALFRKTVGKVKPITSDTLLLTPNKKPKPAPQPQNAPQLSGFKAAASEDIATLSSEQTISYAIPGLQKNTLKRLRQGYFELHSSLDLHGCTRQQARSKIDEFLQNSINRHHHCVQIIHGKGHRSANNQPLLKNDVNHWLRQHQAVKAFSSAPQKAGGAGALFVLLRRS